jgi:anti-sigma regulatory factor (Ser/Thr protein kinase)
VTTVITAPERIDDVSFEKILEQVAPLPLDERILLDCRKAKFATPYGTTAMLTLAQTRLSRPALAVPEDDDVSSYWVRSNFLKYAEELYELDRHVQGRGRPSDRAVLLEVTPITKTHDVHTVVEKIQEKAQEILVGTLHLERSVVLRFAMALAEVCGNIVEHAQTGGWVAVQHYQWNRLSGRRVVAIAVCDAGIGFRQSLESSAGRKLSDRWDDGMALEDSVVRGVSRYPDKGRGHGLQEVKKFVLNHDGKFSVRSGTARITPVIPEWDPAVLPLEKNLSNFQGSQIQITIPEMIR